MQVVVVVGQHAAERQVLGQPVVQAQFRIEMEAPLDAEDPRTVGQGRSPAQ